MEIEIETTEGPIGVSEASRYMLEDIDRVRNVVIASCEEAAKFLPGAPAYGDINELKRRVGQSEACLRSLIGSASIFEALRRKAEKVEAEQGSDFD